MNRPIYSVQYQNDERLFPLALGLGLGFGGFPFGGGYGYPFYRPFYRPFYGFYRPYGFGRPWRRRWY